MRVRAALATLTSVILAGTAMSSPFTGGAPAAAAAQDPAPLGPPADLSTLKNFLPLEKPANLKPSTVADLSGAWISTPY